MRAILPLNLLHLDEPQIRLVDERRRLQRVPDPLTLHVARRQTAQLLVHERQQRVERIGFAPVPGEEQRRRVRRWLENARFYALLGRCTFLPAVPAL